MFNIILMSHGNLAKELYNSSCMILGNFNQCNYVCMHESEGADMIFKRLEKLIIESDGRALVICDLKGGTPFNVAMMCQKKYPLIKVVTGLNLPMVLESAMMTSDLSDKKASQIVEVGQKSIELVSILNQIDDSEENE